MIAPGRSSICQQYLHNSPESHDGLKGDEIPLVLVPSPTDSRFEGMAEGAALSKQGDALKTEMLQLPACQTNTLQGKNRDRD